jgi:hypothetical protein
MRLRLLALASILAVGSSPLLADSFAPYPTVGSIAPTTTVAFTGGSSITGYFYDHAAAFSDTISIYNLTKGSFLTPTTVFPNQTTPIGTEVTFTAQSGSSLNIGDILVFELTSATFPGNVFASDPTFSTDGINHAYMTPFNGWVGTVPNVTGTFVSLEDLPLNVSDLDYNDSRFVFTNIAATPEPSSFIMLGTGLIGAAGALRRKFAR